MWYLIITKDNFKTLKTISKFKYKKNFSFFFYKIFFFLIFVSIVSDIDASVVSSSFTNTDARSRISVVESIDYLSRPTKAPSMCINVLDVNSLFFLMFSYFLSTFFCFKHCAGKYM